MNRLVRGLITMVTALAVLAAFGCGSDGDGGRIQTLQADLAELRADTERLEGELDDADTRATEAETVGERLETLLLETTAELEDAEEEIETSEAEIAEAQRLAAEAQRSAREAEERAAEVERTREASQRAQYLQAEMLMLTLPAQIPLTTDIMMNVPSRGLLEASRPGTSWGQVTLGGSGLRSATMPLTSAANTGKTVVYTDRELSRPLLEHFGFLRDPNNLNQLEFTTDETYFLSG